MNTGESGELLLKLTLVAIRDGKMANLGPLTSVSSVGFDNKEYGSLPSQLSLKGLSACGYSELKNCASLAGISKSPHLAKSDVYINGDGYSVKSLAGAPAALVNHTARPGFEMACKCMGVDIAPLDRLVERYWDLRVRGTIAEDTRNSDRLSPFRDSKDALGPILRYFLFRGTGKGLSRYPAKFILDYEDPIRPVTWRVLTEEQAIDVLWNKLTFSVRAKKGMPTDYPYNSNNSQNTSIERWAHYFQNEYRGALHIRASK